MSRLEAVAKALFYPTPPRVVRAIANHLAAGASAKGRKIRLLDPCSGTGEPAATIADSLGAESYGVELSPVRFKQSQAVLDHALQGDAIWDVRMAHGGWSIIYENPPYDFDSAEKRLEHRFLTRFAPQLATDGILVWVVPQARLASSGHHLCSHYRDHVVYRFPDPEFDSFGQVVLFAKHKASPFYDLDAKRRLDKWAVADLPPLPDDPEQPLFTVPALREADVLFAPDRPDPDLACFLARRDGVMAQRAIIDMIRPPEEKMVVPLTPIKRGHLVQLTQAGLLDDSVLRSKPGEVPAFALLVKGTQTKRFQKMEVTEDEAKQGIEREREVLETTLQVLNLLTGELEVAGDKKVVDEHQTSLDGGEADDAD